ncbi:MAG: hypothetical protein MUF33_01935 [Candidatus Nanopelagicales bacterium]|jgi:hypothetical protein|nr:hypothetical protein [Candidatus Nanopelagicales bacterium]MCU0297261.1 hypothetical protein [Candidatus Nanopelagicales bacterium]
MTQFEQLGLGLAVGAILTQVVTRLRVRERDNSPALHLARRLSDPRLLTATLEGGSDAKQVRYSPHAEEQLQRLGVNREHVETVLSQPTRTTRRSQVHTVQLERDFGSHTLRLQVAEPWPTIGAVHVKQVEWC